MFAIPVVLLLFSCVAELFTILFTNWLNIESSGELSSVLALSRGLICATLNYHKQDMLTNLIRGEHMF